MKESIDILKMVFRTVGWLCILFVIWMLFVGPTTEYLAHNSWGLENEFKLFAMATLIWFLIKGPLQ